MNRSDYPEYLELMEQLESFWWRDLFLLFDRDRLALVDDFIDGRLDPNEQQLEELESVIRERDSAVDFVSMLLLMQLASQHVSHHVIRWQSRKHDKPYQGLSQQTTNVMAEQRLLQHYEPFMRRRRRSTAEIAKRSQNGRQFSKILKDYHQMSSQRTVRTFTNSFGNESLIANLKNMYPLNVLKKGWLSKRDGRVRPDHIIADRSYHHLLNMIYIDDLFYVGGEFLPYPAGGSIPENNINCRCSLTFQIL